MKKQIELSKRQVVKIFRALAEFTGFPLPGKAAYAIARSKKILEPIFEAVEAAIGFTSEERATLEAHDRLLVKLAKEHGIEPDNGRFEFPDPEPEDVADFRKGLGTDAAKIRLAKQIRETEFFNSDPEHEVIELFTVAISDLFGIDIAPQLIEDIIDIITEE